MGQASEPRPQPGKYVPSPAFHRILQHHFTTPQQQTGRSGRVAQGPVPDNARSHTESLGSVSFESPTSHHPSETPPHLQSLVRNLGVVARDAEDYTQAQAATALAEWQTKYSLKLDAPVIKIPLVEENERLLVQAAKRKLMLAPPSTSMPLPADKDRFVASVSTPLSLPRQVDQPLPSRSPLAIDTAFQDQGLSLDDAQDYGIQSGAFAPEAEAMDVQFREHSPALEPSGRTSQSAGISPAVTEHQTSSGLKHPHSGVSALQSPSKSQGPGTNTPQTTSTSKRQHSDVSDIYSPTASNGPPTKKRRARERTAAATEKNNLSQSELKARDKIWREMAPYVVHGVLHEVQHAIKSVNDDEDSLDYRLHSAKKSLLKMERELQDAALLCQKTEGSKKRGQKKLSAIKLDGRYSASNQRDSTEDDPESESDHGAGQGDRESDEE